MKVDASTRRANVWLFLGLVVFSIALCALVLLWMRSRVHAQGGRVYPPTTLYQFCHPDRIRASLGSS